MSGLRLRLVVLVAALLQFISFTSGAVHDASWSPDYVLEATAKNITLNCRSRYSVVVNGTSPGPALYLKEGQTTWIRVWNRIPDQNFTLHWHGLSQRTSPFSDGTPLVSQWPIAPNEYFDYEVRPDVGDAGTYFYHSHIGMQAITAHGALIVEDAGKAPYDYNDDVILQIGDFYPANDSVIVKGLLADPFKWPGEPQAVLINGQSGNASFSNATDPTCTPAVINVTAGSTYRIRFVGRTAISLVTLGIEDHDNLTIIEADGAYTKPFSTDHMQVATGQRFSLLFTAKTEAELRVAGKTQYWIRYESRDRPVKVTGYALLQYNLPSSTSTEALPSTLPASPPVTLPAEVNNWLEYSLEALEPTDPFPTLSEVTRTIYITMEQMLVTGSYTNKTLNGTVQWGQNTLAWQEGALADQNRAPYLVDVYTKGLSSNYTAALSHNGYDPVSKAWPALVGETLDIVWLSNSGPTGGWDFHPMHAHGGHYWDLGSGNGTYNATANELAHFASGQYTPVKRDTTVLYRYAVSGQAHTTAGWRAWRIRVTEDNVGVWMMHCHILMHMVMGMQTVWTFGNATQILETFPVEPYVNGYLEFGGSAYGNESFDPLVAEMKLSPPPVPSFSPSSSSRTRRGVEWLS